MKQDKKALGLGGIAVIVALLFFGLKASGEAGGDEGNGSNGSNGSNGGNGGNGNGAGQANFVVTPELECIYTGPVNGYYSVTFKGRITNNGSARGSCQLEWGTNEFHDVTGQDDFEVEGSQIINLDPGEYFDWQQTWTEIEAYYMGYFKCWLFLSIGAEYEDSFGIGVFQ